MIPHAPKGRHEMQVNDLQDDYEKSKHVKWYDQVLLNRPLKVVIAFILLAILTPLLIYRFLFFTSLDLPPSDGFSVGSCFVPRTSRLLCGMGNVTSQQCHPQCCYDLGSNMCFHRFPSRFSYIMDWDWTEEVVLKPRVATVPYASQSSLTSIRLSIDEVSSTHLALTFYNAAEKSLNGKRIQNKDYTYTVSSPELNVIVNSTQGAIFNTIRGPLIASENIWELAFKLTEESMYGLGELPLKEDTVKVIYNHNGGMSSIPLIFAKYNGSYHGALIDMVSPTEITIRSENHVVIRSITSTGLKIHLFVGPKPVDVMRDVMKFLGSNKELHYWMLGAHICSEPPTELNSTHLNTFISNARIQNIPFDSHCGLKPIVFNTDCGGNRASLVNDGVTILKNSGKRFVPHVSPYIIYKDKNGTVLENNETNTFATSDKNCFNIEDYNEFMLHSPESTEAYKGLVENLTVVYPNYDNVSEEFMQKLWIYSSDLDAVIMENTWPLDESEKLVNQIQKYLPYFNENFENAFNHTPQWNATQTDGERYLYRHNEYGNHFATAFEKINGHLLTWKSSQWLKLNGITNRQNIPTSWTHLQRELIEAALGGISGHWLWSSPICGDMESFNNSTQSSLCVKWYMAGTYMPMIKLHSKDIGRDPLSFIGTHRSLMINALRNRYSLLPYFFTTLQEGPLLRPMFYQFPDSEKIKDINTQFSVGEGLLIVPNLQPSQSHVHIWMPPGSWYEFWSGLKIVGEEGEAVTMTTTEADFLTLVRGGTIIALQKDVRLTTDDTRLHSQYTLTIALDCMSVNSTEYMSNNTECLATGKLYMAPNMTIAFEANKEKIITTAKGDDFESFCGSEATRIWAYVIKEINVYGLDDEMNNYDNHRRITTTINLCELQTNNEIVFPFVT